MKYHDFITSRWIAVACVVFVLIALSACGSGGGGGAPASPPANLPPATVVDNCDSTSVPDTTGGCVTFAKRVDAMATTPFTENGQPVTLEVVIFKPLTGTRFPTVVFNHGSTGNGSDPSLFDNTFTSKSIARFLVERGWLVAFPQRRGRGRSGGLYDEGFTPNRSGYSCNHTVAVAGAARALDDLDAAVDWLRQRDDVDTTRIVASGTSRGGILALAHAARRPEVYRGAINFVGGWLGEGCGDYASVNRALFVDGAAFGAATLWLYGANDAFYSLGHSRANHDAYAAAGGLGTFLVFNRGVGRNGHFLINDPALWGDAFDDYVGGF